MTQQNKAENALRLARFWFAECTRTWRRGKDATLKRWYKRMSRRARRRIMRGLEAE